MQGIPLQQPAVERPANPIPPRGEGRLELRLATTPAEIDACQALRHEVFGIELGARLDSPREGRDMDRFDPWCRHLLVRDRDSGAVVGCTRLLDEQGARRAGGFYSEQEFELSAILAQPGPKLELGRTCIRPDHRRGPALPLLWRGIAALVRTTGARQLFGCASLPMTDGGYRAHAIMAHLRDRHLAPESSRVTPRLPLPEINQIEDESPELPVLLRAYLRLGMQVCGEPCWDPDFGVADLFVLLDLERVPQRYLKRFLGSAAALDSSPAPAAAH